MHLIQQLQTLWLWELYSVQWSNLPTGIWLMFIIFIDIMQKESYGWI